MRILAELTARQRVECQKGMSVTQPLRVGLEAERGREPALTRRLERKQRNENASSSYRGMHRHRRM